MHNATTIERNDNLLSVELSHRVNLPIDPLQAGLIIAEMGDPAFERGDMSAWYGYLIRGGIKVPFGLLLQRDGQVAISASVLETESLAIALDGLAPPIEFVQVHPAPQVRVS